MDATTAVQESINVYINPDETLDAQQAAFVSIADYVVQQSMQDLIELLEDRLISDDDRERNRATTLLAELFHHRKLPLGASVIHLYVVFFSHRLSDYPSVIPSVQALIGLVQMYENEFDPKYMDALDIFQSVFRSVPVSSCAQTVRFKVLLLFKAVLGNVNFLPTLEAHGAAILDGLVSCTEEEKDPRCLQEVFTLMHVAIKLFWKSLSTRVALPPPVQENNNEEDAMDVQAKTIDEAYTTMLLSARLFDALSCYFPITFTPPPNDPFGITPEGLTSGLEDCLCTYLGPSSTVLVEDSVFNSDAAPNSVAAKRKLEPPSTSAKSVAPDGNAIVRLSVPFFVEQLTTDMHIAKIHALRALARIVRTNPLHHRVFGLQSATSEGNPGTGKEGNNRVTAEEAKLYAMVEDGDADYSDMYIQEQATIGTTTVVPLTPQQRLTQSLQQLQMDLYNMTTDQDTMPEHLAELQMHSLTLIGELCKAFGAELSTGNRSSWDSFAAPLLDKIVFELSAEISSAKAKSAVDIAYVMTRMGGEACCAEVLHKLAPFLLQYAVETYSNVTQAVQRGAQETLRGVDRVLNLAAANKATARGGTINSEDGKLAVGLEMLAQLIACVDNGSSEASYVSTGGSSHHHSHAHSHGHSGGGCGHDHGKDGHSCNTKNSTSSAVSAGSVASFLDHSHGHHHSAHSANDEAAVCLALQPYAAQICDALYSYTSPTMVDTPATTSGVAVNPFAAVRSAFAEDSNAAPVSGDFVPAVEASGAENARVPVLVVPAPAVLAIVGSISATKELFSRCAVDLLPTDKIHAYVRNVTQLAVQGLPYLYRTDPSVLTVEHTAGADAQSPAEVLHRSCLSFLVSLCSLDSTKSAVSVADEILSSHCVTPLLSLLAECNGATAVSFADRRAYEVLGALGRECTMRSAARNTGNTSIGVGSLLDLLVPHLMAFIQSSVTSLAECPAGGDRLVLALHTLVEILSTEPAPVTDKDNAVCSNQLKAEYLLRTACYEVSFTQQLLQLLIGNIDALVSFTSTALPVVEHTYTLLRRLILALPSSIQATYAIDLLQLLLAEVNTATSNGRAFIVSAIVNILVYLDKGSALWAEAGRELLESCCEFSWFQLSNVADTAAMFHTPSVVDFSAAQLVALIVNKVHNEDVCERTLQKALQVFAHSVHGAKTSDFTVHVVLLLWVTKAVSMRPNLKLKLKLKTEQWSENSSVAVGDGGASARIPADLLQVSPVGAALPNTWQEYLISVLLRILTYQSTEDYGPVRSLQLAMASHVSILTTDHNLILSIGVRPTATNATLFWKQKLWNRLFTKLQTAEVSRSEPPFTAVLRMLSVCALSTGVPVNIMQDSLTQLASVVVSAMSYRPKPDCPEKDCTTYVSACAVLSQQSMCTLEVLLKHDAQLFIPYLNFVMPALVETSLSASSAKLRATALEGLLSITEHVPYARLFPFKALVSKGLVKALDDRKKAVRVLAGRVRNKWIVMK